MPETRNFGIFAHVDAGKTSLSESLLKHALAIRSLGQVDKGTAHLDRMDLERKRGISIRSSVAQFMYKDVQFNLIDTPGHADFISEVERAMWALDGAILIVSAVEKVEAQTEILFKTLQKNFVPTLVFVNKMDRENADLEGTVSSIKKLLSPCVFDVLNTEDCLLTFSEFDENILEKYINKEQISASDLLNVKRTLTQKALVYPLLYGSALKEQGVQALLDEISTSFPYENKDSAPLCGVVFDVENDKSMGQKCLVRLFSGCVSARDSVDIHTQNCDNLFAPSTFSRKITQIRHILPNGQEKDVGTLKSNDIGAFYGLTDVQTGDVVGDKSLLPKNLLLGDIKAPLLTSKVVPDDLSKVNDLHKALQFLTLKDPLLHATYYKSTRENHVEVMGAIQLEVLKDTLLNTFQLPVHFEQPTVIYKETLQKPSVGFVAYTMPKPCWAVLKFTLEPLKTGSGVQFKSIVPFSDIMERYQNQVKQALPLALKQGRMGYPVTDVLITLVDGEHHLMHTHPLDFIVATPMAIQDGLQRAGSLLLEPVLHVTFTLKKELQKKLMSDILHMRGTLIDTTIEDTQCTLQADIPFQAFMDYPISFAQLTSGRGQIHSVLKEYAPLHHHDVPPMERLSVDPLDSAKYILSARNALDGGIFD